MQQTKLNLDLSLLIVGAVHFVDIDLEDVGLVLQHVFYERVDWTIFVQPHLFEPN